MKAINKTVRQFDLFGVQLNLNIKQQEKYRSPCGGIISLIMMTLLGLIFINRLINIFQKDDYTIKVQSIQNRDPYYSIMNSDNFMIAFQVSDPFKEYFPTLNKTAFNITIQQLVIQTLKNGTKVRSIISQLQLEKCTTQHFSKVNFVDQQQIRNQLSSFLCLPLNYSLYLQGTYNSEIFYYPKLLVELCQADDCYTEEERQSVMKGNNLRVTFSTLIQSNIFMTNNTENYLYSYVNSDFYLQTDLFTKSYSDLFFKYNKIRIDDNLISSLDDDIQEINYWQYQLLDFREYKNSVTSPDILFEMNFRLNQEQEITTKTAYRLDQFMSYLGGMLKFFTAIFGLFAIKYNQLALRLSLANSLYQFNIPKKNNEGRIEFSYDKLLNYIQISINRVDELLHKLKNHTHQVVKISRITRAFTNINNTSFKQQKDQIVEQKISQKDIEIYTQNLMEFKENFIQKLIQKILDTRRQLKLGINFLIYVLMCCSCIKKIWMTRKLIVQCNRMVQRDLDIVNILSKIQQIDKLKQVLLDQDQIKVFDYIPKPIVYVDKKYQIVTEEEDMPNQLIMKANEQRRARVIKKRTRYNKPKKFLKIYDSYLKLKDNNSTVNNRLIQRLGLTMEMIFQKYHEIQILAQKKDEYLGSQVIQTQTIYQQDQIITNKSQSPSFKFFQQIPAKTLNDEEIIELNF